MKHRILGIQLGIQQEQDDYYLERTSYLEPNSILEVYICYEKTRN